MVHFFGNLLIINAILLQYWLELFWTSFAGEYIFPKDLERVLKDIEFQRIQKLHRPVGVLDQPLVVLFK